MKLMGMIHEHEIIKTKLEIQEQALKNFVHEIHDNIGQILSLAKLHLGTLDFSKPEEVAQKTFNSNQLIGKAIKDLRNLARHLDANHICRVGLLKSIQYELGFLPGERAAAPLLTVNDNIGPLGKEIELMLFRIVQGGIHYFLEQSATSHISVEVQSTGDQLNIIIMNKEVHQPAAAGDIPQKQLGILHHRTALIGASLQLQQPANDETSLCITYPFSSQ